MADEDVEVVKADEGEGETENKQPVQDNEEKNEDDNDGKKRNSKAEARRQKWKEELQKKREKLGIPWGPDPCITMRVTLGKQPAGELTSIKGSQFPWYVAPRKYEEIKKEEEILYDMEREKIASGNVERFKESNKRFLEELYLLSKKVQKQRKWEANRPLGSEMTYKEYNAKMEIRRIKQELKRQERAKVKKIEKNVEHKLKQQEEGTKKKGKPLSKLKLFPRWYPMTVIPEFIYTLKLIEKQQNQSEPCRKKLRPRKKTRKDGLMQEFMTFLDELRTATGKMKRYENNIVREESVIISDKYESEIMDFEDEEEESVDEESDIDDDDDDEYDNDTEAD